MGFDTKRRVQLRGEALKKGEKLRTRKAESQPEIAFIGKVSI